LTEPSQFGGGAPMPSGETQKAGGWNRIHLVVDDLDATVTRLRAAGNRFRNDVVQGVGGKQILLQDPAGNLVELFQPNRAEYRAPGGRSVERR
jgi:catechol 2,3-dioxygenase-like lactoylglutathione lyase family enzyme